jgi:Flp pilus assembly protein TadD
MTLRASSMPSFFLRDGMSLEVWLWVFCFYAVSQLTAQTNAASSLGATNNQIVMMQGKVEVALAGSDRWSAALTNQILYPGDRVRTLERSRAAVYLTNGMTIQKGEFSDLEIPPTPRVSFLKGLLKIFNRDRNRSFDLNLPGATAAIRGTDFLVHVYDDGHSELTVLDGDVLLSNALGTVQLTNGQRGIVINGGAPTRTAAVEAESDLIQWFLYYPAVLDTDELAFSTEERQAVEASLTAYQAGDLLKAVADYPWQAAPMSDAGRVYRAALLLAVGKVDDSQKILETLPATLPATHALNKLIAAVKFQALPSADNYEPSTASEWLAESYYRQSRNQERHALEQAREAAYASVTNAPNFGFGWERVAELEFSFGRTEKALSALETSLKLAPGNAQAVSLKGFLLAAQNNISAAFSQFVRAIAMDSALGNAWLGRGLCQIREGRSEEGLRDLLVAASLESQRSLLRSYLGKAFADTGDYQHAMKELILAKHLDEKDPTSWLYSALLKQQENRINEGISDLEVSQDRNDNRSLFRSRLLLDQDRAVGSANLASIYRDAGMTDVAVREAARAVTYDYANESAHLFLSDSYNELRDPTRFNLRYETVWFNELLLANLLSPVGGGRLSQHVSQQEYSRLFEADGLHLANSTLLRSDGMYTELASQFGTFGGTSYALDLDYQHNNGVRPNNGLDDIEWYSTIKQQITPQDTALVLIKYEDYHSGDNFQYYYQTNARPDFHFDEYQHPIVVGGWHHEWAPGVHTLLLGGRLENEQFFSDQKTPQLVLVPNLTPPPPVRGVLDHFDASYHGKLEIYTAELNQILQSTRLTLSVGARYQSGTFDTAARLYNPTSPSGSNLDRLFGGAATDTIYTSEGFERITGYGYLTVEPLDRLWFTGGLAYDELTYPRNFRNPPISSGQDHRDQLGPKAAVVWSPVREATLRGVFTRSLGGVSLDESYRLEQSQLAGFPQTFRSLISESEVGSVSAPEYQTFGLALDLKFPLGWYGGIQAERLESHVSRTIGLFVPTLSGGGFIPPFIPSSTIEQLDYRENSITFSLNKIVGKNWVIGAAYKFDQVELHDVLPNVPVSVLATADLTKHSDLHQTTAYILFNHPSGFFARADIQWYRQSNSGDPNAGPGDDFVQENIYAGYRFLQRRLELTLAILNLSGQNYQLSPLTAYQELPRERTFAARLNFRF